ncbi:multicopper oxidase protein [Rutstroemia sp. NJR-2017a WRK4]|nr:multicopper oxidase protein [Rutstroemia sp. NJR-2017a WRK4]
MLRKLLGGLALASAFLPFTLGYPSAAGYGNGSSGPRQFDLTLTWEKISPVGVSRDMVLINGQFPGPLLEINEGDEVWVNVHNKLPFNTTMHYHGIEMVDTPWSDGVPGLSQREILPGGSFLYKWKALQYGEYWYHSHHRGQIDDGQFGPLVIHPKKSRPTPFGLISQDKDTLTAIQNAVSKVQPLMLSDYRNIPSSESWDIEVAAQMEIPCYDSLLINGKGKIDCWSANKTASLLTAQQKQLLGAAGDKAFTAKSCLPKDAQAKIIAGNRPGINLSAIPAEIFDVCTPTKGSQTVIDVKKDDCSDKNGTWSAFEVVGAYSTLTTAFSIDELDLWVYAVDGEYITPQRVQAITVTNGDRYSFLVHLTAFKDYTIRHACTLPIQLISGQATLSYRSGDKHSAPANQTSKPYVSDAGVALNAGVVFFNQSVQKSYPPFPVAQKADQTVLLEIGNTETAYQWALNGTSQPMTLDTAKPILFAPQPNVMNNLTITTLNNTWVDIIFATVQVPQPSHPIHKHGNKMWLIGSGHGAWNWSSVEEAAKAMPQNFNFVDPPRRDGFSTVDAPRDPTWIAVRYHVTNPGAWMIHCHATTHLLGGMSMAIQDGIDHWPQVPSNYVNYNA